MSLKKTEISSAVKFLVAIAVMLFISSGCKSSGKVSDSHFVYTICGQELSGNDLSFCFKNCSSETVKSITVVVGFKNAQYDDDFAEIPLYEKKIPLTCCPGNKNDVTVNLEDFLMQSDFFSDEDNTAEDFFYIERIYAKEIVYENDLLWNDPYGSWCF